MRRSWITATRILVTATATAVGAVPRRPARRRAAREAARGTSGRRREDHQ